MSLAAALERLRRGSEADHPFAIADALAAPEATASTRRSSCLPTTQRRRACRRILLWRKVPLWSAFNVNAQGGIYKGSSAWPSPSGTI